MSQLHLEALETLFPFLFPAVFLTKLEFVLKRQRLNTAVIYFSAYVQTPFSFCLCEFLKSNIYYIVFKKETG